MTRNEKYAACIAQTVLSQYPQDVSLLVAYGSFVNGTENPLSDVDLYFVPASERSMELCRTWLIEGIGYDLFPIDWERLERIADFSDPLTPLLQHIRILYCRSEADAARFARLQQKQRFLLADPAHMLSAANARAESATAAFGRLCLTDALCAARGEAGYALMLLCDAVAYANGTYFKHGLKKQWQDLAALPSLPMGFLEDYRAVIDARDAGELKARCRHALNETLRFLKERHPQAETPLNADQLAGMLREAISTFNKIKICAENGNAPLAFVSAVCLQDALDEMHTEAGAPACDLLSAFDAEDLGAFSAHAQRILRSLISTIEKGGAGLSPYATMDDFTHAYLGV